jgi:hypothetical protein
MRKVLFGLAACGVLFTSPGTANAAEAGACSDFLWPLATELAWMKAPDSQPAASGATLPQPPADKAVALALLPASQVSFPVKPTSTPKPEDAQSYAGIVTFEGFATPDHYQVTLSAHAWIDVVQKGAPLEATGHTGSKECDGIRKSVRFEIDAGPFSVQISGSLKDTIKIAIRPAAD